MYPRPSALCYPQGEAIAVNLREMFGLRVPIISVVIGEGGSGGALAIGEQCQCAGVLAGLIAVRVAQESIDLSALHAAPTATCAQSVQHECFSTRCHPETLFCAPTASLQAAPTAT